MEIINNPIIDKVLLLLIAFEYLLFGLWGLVDPIAISNMIGLTFNDITAFANRYYYGDQEDTGEK